MTFSDVYTTPYRDEYGSASRSDTYITTYAGAYGTQFRQAPLDVRLALLLSGAWTDISHFAYQRDGTTPPITAGRGRPDESSAANPATFAAEFNNRDGRFSPRNPLGAWYGQLARNTPLRVSVPALEAYLRLENDTTSGATCPDANPLDITSGIDVRIDARPSSYQPCVLASKWLGLVTIPSTTPPATPGATVFKSCVSGAASQLAAGQTFDSWLGGARTPATGAQRIYHKPGDFSSASADDIALLNAKCQLVVSWKPAIDGSDWTALSASISSYVTAAATAGAPPPIITFHHEPQNHNNNLTAAQFIAMMKTYYPLSKAAYPSVPVIYIALTTGGNNSAVGAYYPGDSFCDGLYQDLYANMWKDGTGPDLSAIVAIAGAASPPKPIGGGEIGYTTTSSSKPSTTSFANFMAYVAKVFTTQAANGLPCGAVMLWDGFATGDPSNFTGPSDPRMPALKSWYDALASTASGGGGTTAAQRSWALVLNGDGTLGFWWSSDGTLAGVTQVNSTLPVPLGRQTIRVLAKAAGTTATVTFYTAPPGNADNTGTTAPWVQLGSPVTGLTLKMFSSSAPVAVGYNSAVTADYPTYGGLTGAVFDFELRSFTGQYNDVYNDTYGAPYAGLTVAQASFAGQVEGATAWTDPYGNAWNTTGTAEISQRSYRFHGEMSSLPTTWDVTGTDVWSPVTAGGLLRRLGQGTKPPVDSAFRRAVTSLTGAATPVVYWPCEDLATATQIAPAIGPAPMTFAQSPTFAASTAFAASMALPTMGNGAWTGQAAPYTGGTAVIIRFLLSVPAGSSIADDTVLMRANTTGDIGDLTLRYKTGGQLRFSGYGDQVYLFDTGAQSAFSLLGVPQLVSMEITKNGSGFNYAIRTLTVGSSTPTSVTGTVASSKVGNVTTIHVPGPPGVTFGHIFAQATYEALTDFANPLAAWSGETCANRFARLAKENGYAARVYGYPNSDVAMGVQTPDTLASLLQLCETTGRGLIFEPRRSLSLGYRTVSSLRQQAPAVVADYSLAHLGQDSATLLQPTDDDQRIANDVTVQDGTGTSFEAVLNDASPMSISPPPAGVGDYGSSYTVNTASAAQLPDIAGWILGIGTNAEDRYPAIPFNLARTAAAPLFWSLQDTDVGDYLQVLNPPAWLAAGPVKQLLYGTTESFGGFWWGMSWTTVPEAPYETGIYNDPVFGRCNTDGSQLDAAVPAAAVADGYGDIYGDAYGAAVGWLYVDTTGPSGILWTTLAASFPFDVTVGGETMTVLAVTGAASPQLFTVTRSVNGVVKAHVAGEAVALAHPAIEALA